MKETILRVRETNGRLSLGLYLDLKAALPVSLHNESELFKLVPVTEEDRAEAQGLLEAEYLQRELEDIESRMTGLQQRKTVLVNELARNPSVKAKNPFSVPEGPRKEHTVSRTSGFIRPMGVETPTPVRPVETRKPNGTYHVSTVEKTVEDFEREIGSYGTDIPSYIVESWIARLKYACLIR